jgi:hypothetical protein
MLSLSLTAAAQADLQVLSSLKSTDTVRFSSKGNYGKIFIVGFVNKGPQALTASDTIRWSSPVYAGYVSLRLPATGLPANDTVYFSDTVFVNAAPSSNPFTWCDSIWAKTSTNTIIPDPNTANNKLCHSVRFIQVPNVGVGNLEAENNGLTVYPNPANNQLNFSFDFGNNAAATVTLRDLLGKTVLKNDLGKNISGKHTYSLDVNNVQPGIYFLELSTNGYSTISRIAIQK